MDLNFKDIYLYLDDKIIGIPHIHKAGAFTIQKADLEKIIEEFNLLKICESRLVEIENKEWKKAQNGSYERY